MSYSVGDKIMFSRGEYDDYNTLGTYGVIKDFDSADQLALWAKENEFPVTEETTEYSKLTRVDTGGYFYGQFVEWLITKGFITPIVVQEIYLGDYGEVITEEAL